MEMIVTHAPLHQVSSHELLALRILCGEAARPAIEAELDYRAARALRTVWPHGRQVAVRQPTLTTAA